MRSFICIIFFIPMYCIIKYWLDFDLYTETLTFVVVSGTLLSQKSEVEEGSRFLETVHFVDYQ